MKVTFSFLIVVSVFSLIPFAARAATLAHWSFNNTVSDTTGNISPDGTLVNGATYSATSAPTVGGSGSLDVSGGTTRHFLVADQSAFQFGTNDFTFAAWINPSSSGTSNGRIFDTRGAGSVDTADNPGFQFVIDQTGTGWKVTNTFLVSGPGTYIDYTIGSFNDNAPDVSFSDNAWHHVAMSYDAGTGATFYVDGVFHGSVSAAIGDITSGLDMNMGNAIYLNGSPSAPSQAFTGLIDEVFLFDQALSQDAINLLIQTNSAVAPIPEPNTFALCACASLMLIRRKRQSAKSCNA